MAARLEQKARTRQAIIDAAARLLAEGTIDPSMEEIAEAARVSRATAYRYFDTALDAVWQVASDRIMTDVDEVVEAAGDDVVARVLAAEQVVNDYLFGDPDGTRAFERAMLDRRVRGAMTDADRPARRLRFIDAALEPLGDLLSEEELGRIRHSLALAIGSQALVATIDTCRLDVDRARDVTRFACQAIAHEALRLAEANPT